MQSFIYKKWMGTKRGSGACSESAGLGLNRGIVFAHSEITNMGLIGMINQTILRSFFFP